MRHKITDRSFISQKIRENGLFCAGWGLSVLLVAGLLVLAYPPRTHPVSLSSPALPPVSMEIPAFQGGVDVNTADAAALSALPGIGASLAELVIAEREFHGPFYFPEDLLIVKGIGKGKLKQIRDLLTLPAAPVPVPSP